MKPGWKTTEFWATIVGGVLANFGPVAEAAGPQTSAWVTAAAAAAYVLSRGVAKMNVPADPQ